MPVIYFGSDLRKHWEGSGRRETGKGRQPMKEALSRASYHGDRWDPVSLGASRRW